MLRPLVSDRKYLQVTQAIPPRPQMESLYTKAAGRVASERWTHMWLNVQQGRKVKQHSGITSQLFDTVLDKDFVILAWKNRLHYAVVIFSL